MHHCTKQLTAIYTTDLILKEKIKQVTIEWHTLCTTLDDSLKVSTNIVFKVLLPIKTVLTMGTAAKAEAEKIQSLGIRLETSLTNIFRSLESIQIRLQENGSSNPWIQLTDELKDAQQVLSYRTIAYIPVRRSYESTKTTCLTLIDIVGILEANKGFKPYIVSGIKHSFIAATAAKYIDIPKIKQHFTQNWHWYLAPIAPHASLSVEATKWLDRYLEEYPRNK